MTEEETTEKRLFIACPVQGTAVESELNAAWERIAPMWPAGVAGKREPTLHITLRFLGGVDLADPERTLSGKPPWADWSRT